MRKYLLLTADTLGSGISANVLDTLEEAIGALQHAFINDLENGLSRLGVSFHFTTWGEFEPEQYCDYCNINYCADRAVIRFKEGKGEIQYQIRELDI